MHEQHTYNTNCRQSDCKHVIMNGSLFFEIVQKKSPDGSTKWRTVQWTLPSTDHMHISYMYCIVIHGMLNKLNWIERYLYTNNFYTVYLPMFWNNYQSHLLGSSSPRNVSIYQSILRYMPEECRSHLQCSRILKSWITVTVVIFQFWNLCTYQKE